jgi:transcriptional regulator with XRE-family HTH domain
VHAGDLLREWRQRRRLSQLDLAIAASVSSRHLSFVETGRSRPTSEMILHLAEHLDVPLRDRNALLLAGGYAPAYPEHGLDEPELKAVQQALGCVLASHEPYPAVVVNRWWELVDANGGIAQFTRHVSPALLEPPVNVLRLSLHPDGMAPRIVNLPEWRAHLLARLHRQADVVVPLRYRAGRAELSFLSITAMVGTPMDVTVEELAIESFYPADDRTAAALAGSARDVRFVPDGE